MPDVGSADKAIIEKGQNQQYRKCGQIEQPSEKKRLAPFL
jgi:hypothetical protein